MFAKSIIQTLQRTKKMSCTHGRLCALRRMPSPCRSAQALSLWRRELTLNCAAAGSFDSHHISSALSRPGWASILALGIAPNLA